VDVTFITASRGLEIGLKALTAILNSPLVFCWLYFRGKRKGAQLELYPKPLYHVPIPVITEGNRPLLLKINGLVEKILLVGEQPRSDDFDAMWSEINDAVFDLYGLTEAERSLVIEWRDSLPVSD